LTEESKQDQVKEDAERGKPKTNPLWTITSFFFMILLMIAFSVSLFDLYYGSSEDQQLSNDVQKAYEAAMVSQDLWDARLRVDLLCQFPESSRATILKSLSTLGIRSSSRSTTNAARMIFFNARAEVLGEAETLLQDGHLSRLEQASFIGLLKIALEHPERLLPPPK
jgi:hypothetical protein